MARTTKIPCEGVIYTVHEDAYGTTVESDEAAEALAGGTDESDVRARYAQVLAELDELEETLAEDETQAARAGQFDAAEGGEEEDSFPLL